MKWSIQQTTPPGGEPISLEEAKAHLRVTSASEDSLIASLISAARQHAEDFTRRQLMTATFVQRMDRFPSEFSGAVRSSCRNPIRVYRPPLQSVASITYIDTAGVTQTWAAERYKVDPQDEPGRIVPAYGYSYPDTRDEINAVTITFDAGYSSADDVPKPIRQALLLMVGELFERREEGHAAVAIHAVPLGVKALLGPYRVVRF